ncbi:MAG: acetate/propionate family kinase [Actinobacteria bacterium]|nr:acetate/propionate family kinase [Actinomycetota bacterium]
MEQKVLVINSGSSSIKYKLLAMNSRETLIEEKIEAKGNLDDAVRHLDHQLQALAPLADDIIAVGHRVVHGGREFSGPTYIDDSTIQSMMSLERYAPLHTRSAVAGIRVAEGIFPNIPQVAVFDTAFHTTMPEHASTYALPRALTETYGIRRTGFHGISAQYTLKAIAKALVLPPAEFNLIVAHLGAGSSITAIQAGRSVDTSMGFTPLEGLVMSTRCGDIDPSLPLMLQEDLGLTPQEVYEMLNNECGLLGLCGTGDMRSIHSLASSGYEPAILALDVYCYRIRKYIGAYCAVLGHVDALAFTGGIGENDSLLRSMICEGLEFFGMELAEEKNASVHGDIHLISNAESLTQVFVVKTDEESEIAEQVLKLVEEGRAL